MNTLIKRNVLTRINIVDKKQSIKLVDLVEFQPELTLTNVKGSKSIQFFVKSSILLLSV